MNQMQELYRKVAGDSTLQEEFNMIMLDAAKGGQNAAATEEKLLTFARDAGFAITLGEMQSRLFD